MAEKNEFNQYPQMPPENRGDAVQAAVTQALEAQKKKKKKKRLIIFGVIAVVIIIIIAAASSGSDNKVEPIDSSSSSQNAGTQENTGGQSTQKVTPGNVVSTKSLEISFISFDSNTKQIEQYFEPDAGTKVVRAEFKFKNISSTDVSLSGFDCYADDKKCEEFYGGIKSAFPTLESVSPGRTFDAVVYYQVPENAKSIELELSENLWSDKKIVFAEK